jgi:16S rRNA processing protein RimM
MSEGAHAPSPGRLVALGEIVGTHGVAGLLRLHPFDAATAPALALGGPVFLTRRADAGAPPREAHVLAARPHGRLVLLKLEGLDDLDGAAALVGTVVSVPESALPPPGPNELYVYQLEGLEVVTVGGERLGRVASLFPTGANEVLVVRNGDREYLIPVIADVVKDVDLAAGRVVIEPLAGLLE